MKRIYKHTGKGFYIGSCVIVVEDSHEKACELIRVILNKMGLMEEPLNVSEFRIIPGAVIHSDNGDY